MGPNSTVRHDEPPPIAGGATPVPAVRTRGYWSSPRVRRANIYAYLCLLPWILGFLGFTLYPVVASFYFSLTEYPILNGPTFIGLDNYKTMFFGDDLFWQALRVTVVYTLFVVPIGVVVGYSMALLLNQKVLGLAVWRTVYYLPSIVPAVASAYLWSWMFNPDFGLINGFLIFFGIHGPKWFGSETWVMPAFIIMALWGAGGGLVLYLASLQSVPTALNEAASIDGASSWDRMINITLPMTSPVIVFTLITGIIGTFQIFTAGYIITAGGPDNASLFYVLYLFRNGWQYYKMGYASALAWVLLIIMLVLTLLTLWASRRFTYYEYEDR
jgi:multiple sugar transport system permease protein